MCIRDSGIGGFKEVVAMVTGKGAYSKLKYESGVHRVQRVPETESGGRIHTSTATVAVMPEAEEVDVHIDMNDCRIDVMLSLIHISPSEKGTGLTRRCWSFPRRPRWMRWSLR